MRPEKLNPASLGDGRVQNRFNCLQALNGFDPVISPSKIQEHQASFIARKYRLSREIAETIALLAFGEAR
jgi:hypothetical protein